VRDNADDGSPSGDPAPVEVLRFDETLLLRLPRPESRGHYFCIIADVHRVYHAEGAVDPWVVDLTALDEMPPPLALALRSIQNDFLKNGQSFLLVGDAADHVETAGNGHPHTIKTDPAVARFGVRESFAPARRYG
jgi:hypothetical protein